MNRPQYIHTDDVTLITASFALYLASDGLIGYLTAFFGILITAVLIGLSRAVWQGWKARR
jgi:hypothetical protein